LERAIPEVQRSGPVVGAAKNQAVQF
jgi:hypothetical protein